ncbi:MAG: GGDEF domain-containing protein [Gammaproteobacteria bacterium]|nr:GGDEF domain-containing protein [Gammaproteobacteria bacterium]
MKTIKIEYKIIIGIFLFTGLLIGISKYQLTENMTQQYIESQKSKNNLLLNTIVPIIALNLSLGLDQSNEEYLGYIGENNIDLESIVLLNSQGYNLYEYTKTLSNKKLQYQLYDQDILDPLTQEKIGKVKLYFSDQNYQTMLNKNQEITFRIIFMTLVLLIVFTFLVRREFRFLKHLSQNVCNYDPKMNNFNLSKTDRKDEVGIIHNSIVVMVSKINTYAKLLDETNHSLELKVQKRTQELEISNKKLLDLSLTDPLTQLSNRRHFEEHSENIYDIARREKLSVSIVMCDIDLFKKINDTFGHIVGDEVIKQVASLMQENLKRTTDFLARYGGEEFVIIFLNMDSEGAYKICQDIQESLKTLKNYQTHGIQIESVTLSFGVSSCTPQGHDNYKELLNKADLGLYKAKNNGRNCIVINNI